MKKLSLVLPYILFCLGCFAQSDPNDIRGIFSSRNNGDFKLYDGYNVQPYNYYYADDTLFYQFYGAELQLPVKLVDFNKAIIEEEKKWTTVDKEKIYFLKLQPKAGKVFSGKPATSYDVFAKKEVVLFFTSQGMAENALAFLKAPYTLQTNNTAKDDADTEDFLAALFLEADKITGSRLDKILAVKNDVDFECALTNATPSPFKYFVHNDSLWFKGSELFAYAIPFDCIDIKKTFSYESGIWKNATGAKAREIAVYALPGKTFIQDFKSIWGANSIMEERLGGKTITIASLVLPDKELADALLEYLKVKTN